MTEKLREQISALTDDELTPGEHELLLRRFAVDKYLARCWERYHLIGEAMRKNLPPVDTRGFADRVMGVIAPVPSAPAHSLSSRVSRTMTGMAIAACVAVVALVGLRYESLHQQSAPGPAEIVPPAPVFHPGFIPYGRVTDASWNGSSPEVRAELGNYVISHAETSAVFSQQNMLPYFFVASFDTRTPPAPPAPPRKR